MTHDLMDDPIEPRGFIEKIFSNPGAIATVVVAVLGQAIFSIIFQVINNEQQAAQIALAGAELANFKNQVNNMQTPLSAHVFKVEEGILDLRKAYDEHIKRLDALDSSGTRALALVSSNQQRVMSQVDRLGDRLLMQDRKLGELEAKSTNPVLQAKIEEIGRNEARLEDQQRRIIEALDNLYSQVSKIPPVLRNKKSDN